MGVALAGAIAGYSLALIGYIPDAVPTAELITGIRSFSTLIPAAFALLAIFAIVYALTDRQVDMIRELNEASSQTIKIAPGFRKQF